MIKWVETKKLTIFFNKNPRIDIREILPSMTSLEKQDIINYPFISLEKLEITVFYHKEGKKYNFTIPKGFIWNGADIPQIIWEIAGSRFDPQFLIASMLHDYLCLKHEIINNNRRLSSEIFKACLLEANVSNIKASIMCEFVDLFQRMFCGW